jgi:hypothetical protein
MTDETTWPHAGHHDVLRNVRVNGYRLLVWDDHTRYSTGQYRVRYAFFLPRARKPLFLGECGVAPHDPIDSDAALVGILGWLTLKPGDTDADFFADYTPDQLDWCQSSEAQELSWISCDVESSDDESSLHFVNGRLREKSTRKVVFRAC